MIEKAHAATVASFSGATTALVAANEIAQLIGSLVAIVAGCLAIAVYIKKLRSGE